MSNVEFRIHLDIGYSLLDIGYSFQKDPTSLLIRERLQSAGLKKGNHQYATLNSRRAEAS